ncbi:hypothetical protein [Bifidobacterium vansinderenii]|uniref:Uncharacterized protein n=1 Tax=Bifidobacterium vansinderenii TaxID=1984871 RepID=A0A229VUU6_9BIFI|nr:hypothetical protein [Bifidobacterium vansinderenii]OXM99393.1 hypothetical protein Tam10B_2415 [Bifidobacterium vansinderenii]
MNNSNALYSITNTGTVNATDVTSHNVNENRNGTVNTDRNHMITLYRSNLLTGLIVVFHNGLVNPEQYHLDTPLALPPRSSLESTTSGTCRSPMFEATFIMMVWDQAERHSTMHNWQCCDGSAKDARMTYINVMILGTSLRPWLCAIAV